MKIDKNFNANLVNFKDDSEKKSALTSVNKSNDPFDLKLEIKEIKLDNYEKNVPPATVFLCTPGCGMTSQNNCTWAC